MVARNLEMRLITAPGNGQPMVELWCEDGHWGSVESVGGVLYFELLPRPNGEPWSFPPVAVERILEQARQALQGDDGEAAPSTSNVKEAS